MLGHGQTSGMVLNVADTVTSVALVIEFQLIHEALSVLPFGANDLSPKELLSLTQALKQAIDTCPESHRAAMRHSVLVAGRVADLAAYFDTTQESGLCTFVVPVDPAQTVWKGLSVIGDLPSDIRTAPHVKVHAPACCCHVFNRQPERHVWRVHLAHELC